MSIDLTRLEKARQRGSKTLARCPACAEAGADRTGEHLIVTEEGKFGCIMHPGPAGDAHRQRIFELVGERDAQFHPMAAVPPRATSKPLPWLPDLRPLTREEMVQIASVRGWVETAALHEMTQRGLLWHSMVWDDGQDWPAWVITDSGRRNAQARRMDGVAWSKIQAKAKTLPGCDPAWPIGAADIGSRQLVMFCEGGPDFLAALYVAGWEGFDVETVAPVCITGAGNSIHSDALPLFIGRSIRICVHDDQAGRDAGQRWAAQLYQAGATQVTGFAFAGLTRPDGRRVKDLADFAQLFDSGEAPTVRMMEGMT